MLYTYKVTIDNGSAPCTSNNVLSLAICKPKIRKNAKIGDIIVGFCAKSMQLKCNNPQILYIARVTDIRSMENYYDTYPKRKDCIYDSKLQQKKNAFHTCTNINTDLSGKNVLLSNDYIFFGNKYISVNENFNEIEPNRGHFSHKNNIYEKQFIEYFENLKTIFSQNVGKHIHQHVTHC